MALVAVGLGGTPIAVAAPADAETVRRLESEIDELRAAIEALKAEGGTNARLDEIERRLGILATEVEDLKVGEEVITASEKQARPGLGPAASKVYRRDQGVSIGGYGEAVASVPSSTRDDGSESGQSSTFDMLRAIFYVGYKFNEHFLLNTEIELEHASTSESGSASVEFAYIDYLYRDALNLRGGLVLLPMGWLNELHEPTVYLGSLRPLSEQRIIPSTWREGGVGAFGDVGGFSYRTFLVNGLDASGFSAAGLRGGRQKGSKAKLDDVAWSGRLDWVGTPGLQAGLSFYTGNSGQDLEGADGRGVDVPTTIWDVHAEWRWRGLKIRGLYTQADLDDVAALNDELGYRGNESVGERLVGSYLEAGYDLLGGPKGRSLMPYVRWENLNTQDRVPDGWQADPATDQEIFTLGIAYQPIEQIIIKLDWSDVDNAAGTGVDQLNAQLGYIF
ncbi:MAG TPA: septum formation initiator family protein [Candidatus Sulfomarinibacteraceae bacterium]|nr:septum formation initiator family protein [Candidatus Sulfomarinibacteraceae bacterium]